MVIMMVMIIMMILMFDDAQSLFCFRFISMCLLLLMMIHHADDSKKNPAKISISVCFFGKFAPHPLNPGFLPPGHGPSHGTYGLPLFLGITRSLVEAWKPLEPVRLGKRCTVRLGWLAPVNQNNKRMCC